jgi:hypothetical protein
MKLKFSNADDVSLTIWVDGKIAGQLDPNEYTDLDISRAAEIHFEFVNPSSVSADDIIVEKPAYRKTYTISEKVRAHTSTFNKPVYVYRDNKFVGRYDSQTLAAEDLGLNKNQISRAISKQTQHFGYFFSKTQMHQPRKSSRAPRAVEQFELMSGKTVRSFSSIAEAQNKTTIKNISAVCQGNRPNAGGYGWKYAAI